MKQTQRLALGGTLAALALVILLLGGVLGIGAYAGPLLAALILLPAGKLIGKKLHAALWLAVSALGLILVPDPEAALLFFCPIGCYPLLRPYAMKLPKALQLPAKLLFFLVTILMMEALLTLLILPEALPLWLSLLLLALGCAVFVLYDRLIPRAEEFLSHRLSRLLRL